MGMLFHKLLVRLSPYLDTRISAKEFTPYKTLSTNLGGYANRSAFVGSALGCLLEEDQDHGRPHRSASVVRSENSKGAGLPGSGYFWVCRSLGLVSDLDDHDELKAFWKKQIEGLGLEVPSDLASKKFAFSDLESIYQRHAPQ